MKVQMPKEIDHYVCRGTHRKKRSFGFWAAPRKKTNVNNNFSNFATCAEYYELLVVLIECDTSCFDQFGSWAGFRFHKIAKMYVFFGCLGTLKTKLLLADRQTFRAISATISPWRKVPKNLWMHISLGRRDNHATILRKAGVCFGVLHAMVDLTELGHQRTPDTNGQTWTKEVLCIIIRAFGSKMRVMLKLY